jgi:dCMP deaminase
MSTNWDGRFVAMAELVATWSKDPRKKVGAVLVSPDRRHFSIGYNGLPAGFPDDVVLDRDMKNRYTLHAETNAIAQAAQDVRGWTLYVTEAPCLGCALAIHRAGISRVVTAELDPNSLWYAEQSEATEFLGQFGIDQARFGGSA